MKNQTILILLGFFVWWVGGACVSTTKKGSPNMVVQVIPQPAEIQVLTGAFIITAQTKIVVDRGDAELRAIGQFLADKINTPTGYGLTVSETPDVTDSANVIVLTRSEAATDWGDEGYGLTVTPGRIEVVALRPAGLFYGVQTIRQLLPPEIESDTKIDLAEPWSIAAVRIVDKPRFRWRGMLLDCGRHFMSKDFVKRYIDLLAYHKMNRFHWHLTEDQGWRIAIEKYPKLTQVGAWRRSDDSTVYGGFYTQADIKEVVAYASSRYVTVVPEIELPGHSVAALAAYPEFSCTGGPFAVETRWGVHKEVYCAGNDATFQFLEDVLTEVIGLFPGEYIHIGGDECPKDRWRACPKCQNRIAAAGLEDELELQSYFIQRIEKFLETKNRRLIGWDEILEGGLAPGATVQSWRGIDGAIAAAQSGHDAIVSPTSHAYFDYDIGTTDLRKVYSFDPVPPELSATESQHILGGECNMWTESAPQETVDSKVFPRLLAMAECLWSPKETKNFDDFYGHVRRHYQRLDLLGVSYGAESRPVSILTRYEAAKHRFVCRLEAGERDLAIRYAIDDSQLTTNSRQYSGPFVLERSATVLAGAYKNGYPYGEVVKQSLIFHAAIGRIPTFTRPYSTRYPASGDMALTDGIRGSLNFRDGYWQAWEQDDLDAVIDLGRMMPIRRISAGFLQNANSWIFLPDSIVYAVSSDGQSFRTVATLTHTVPQNLQDALTRDFPQELPATSARFVRVYAKNVGICPAWHPGAGGKAWIFADEIIVE